MSIYLSTLYKHLYLCLLCVGVLLLPTAVLAATDNLSATNNNQRNLEDVRQNIAEQEKRLVEQRKQRQLLQKELQTQERAIAESSKILRQAQHELTEIAKEINILINGIAQLERQYIAQQSYLAKQLDSAFRLGRSTGFESMFNAAQAQRNERMLTYYSYISEERKEAMIQLQQTKSELDTQKTQLIDKQTKQKNLLTQQQAEQQKLAQNKTNREKTLKELDASLSQGEQRLAELRQNENRLQQQILKLAQEAKARAEREAKEAEQIRQRQQQPGSTYQPSSEERALMARTSGIGKPQGQLPWPVNGRVTHRFGETLQGELRWKGMTIRAPEGQEVRAIAPGQVLLADWLQGYGLVVIIEHGKGDMSLYGYNQSALVKVGDQVSAGQGIALVGSSGGQQQTALYFEIRREGRALDPQPWLKK